MSRVVLLTGMSAAGKSTVLRELAGRGHRTVDLDDAAWSAWGHLDDDPTSERDWLWREDRVGALLDEAAGRDERLFVAGCAANQGRFRDRFAHIVLLTASVAVTTDRLATRTTNDFGKSSDEAAKILADKAAVEPLLRRVADVEIDTAQPLDTVVAQVLALGCGDG